MGRILIILASLLFGATAQAQVSYPSTATILGSYTLANVPACNTTTQARYAFITDLGGGPDTVLCDGSSWKHIRLGAPASIATTSGNVTITPLASAPIQFVTGNILTSLTLKIDTANLYPGYMLYVRRPGLITGTIGVQMATGGPIFGVLGNSTAIFVYDGTALVQVQ